MKVEYLFFSQCNAYIYYLTSDNVFSDWLTSLVTAQKVTRGEHNIPKLLDTRHLKIEMVFPNYLKSSSQSSVG